MLLRPQAGPQHRWGPKGSPSSLSPWLEHERQIWALGDMQWLSRWSWRRSCIWWSLGCYSYFSEMRPASSRLGFCITFPNYVSFRTISTLKGRCESVIVVSVLWVYYEYATGTIFWRLLYIPYPFAVSHVPLQWKTINERLCSFVHFPVQTVGMQPTPIVINNGSWWIRKAGCEDIDQVL